ncbi:hypothetical protein [Alteraurantiacibacter aquimixticola]|uniref:Hint domain-containing protein n=1 Tax=Alteraurantiacibacter aquimixticola TaxID=2489173 RepID=A0A4T3F0B8_9SPHN|nr:hypothetical protein [Alteraurantiacibacter aquimixticola]TIX49622.1 hypothetical protein E5222_12385 [Alteraurantiacibacter aquimixticola]
MAAPARRSAARRIPGPPPVPTVEPSFADIEDPIRPATERIHEVAGRLLPDQALPPVEASPRGHMPVIPDRPITPAERRLILRGDAGMDEAGLSRVGDPPIPGDPNDPGAERTRLTRLREQLLAPPAATTDGTPPAPLVPPPITVTTRPLPPADLTVAEQQLLTSVLARVIADPAETATRVLRDVKKDMREYPNDTLNNTNQPTLDGLGSSLRDGLQTRLGDRVRATARIMGSAGAMLDNAVSARRTELADIAAGRTRDAAASAADSTSAAASTATTRLGDAATARTAGADARRRAGAAGRPPRPGFRQIAEAAVQRIQAKVSEAIAGFQFQERERRRELDTALARLTSAYELAATADEIVAQRENNLAPGQTPPTDVTQLLAARRRLSDAINRAREWKEGRVRAATAQVRQMKADVTATIAANIRDVETEGATAFRALRDWGATQEGASEQWWTDTVTDLNRWADNAHETATTWADTEARLARLELQAELRRIRDQVEAQINADADQAAGYARMSEGQKRDFIAGIASGSRGGEALGGIADSIIFRQIELEKPLIETTVQSELDALPNSAWEAVEFAAKAKNSGFSASERANAIYAAGEDKIGTDEATIYRQLEGLRPIELAAVTKCYNDRHGNNALYRHLDSELSGDEWRRAQDLMRGDAGAAAAEAIHDAVWGPGTNEAQIMDALRALNNLPEDQRAAARARANAIYLERYGETLDSVLSGDLSGSELGQARALAEGRMDDANAYEMDYALRGGWGRDAGAAAAVYERIRTEAIAEARANNWTAAEFDAAVAARNAAMDASFGRHFANVPNYNWGSGSTLENAVGYTFAFDRGNRDMLNAFANNDPEGIDAGRMEAERRGVYADDEVMGGVVRAQYTRALDRAQLDRGPELRAGVDACLMREFGGPAERARRHISEETVENRRMELQREMDATLADDAFDRSRASVARLDSRLQDRYGITLDTMLSSTMSDNTFGRGGALSDARGRLAIMRRDANDPAARRERRLDWAYARVRFGIEGVGTDMGELRGGMEGLTREDMRELNRRWQRDHPGETLREAIQGDTSGREEDDLVDLYDRGAPATVAERVDELRRRLRRDEAGVGAWGASASRAESAESHRSLERLEALHARMRDPNLPPRQREGLVDVFNQRVDNARFAIEAQRTRVDSFADTITTILQYVVGAIAIVAGAIVSVVSGGTALPAVIAILGSVLGTISGMAAKAAIKGSAYGAEEIGTDIAVGVVDLAVTMATLGLFKGGIGRFTTNASTMMRSAGLQMKEVARMGLRNGLRTAARQATTSAAEQAVAAGLRGSAARRFAGRAAEFGRNFAVEQLRDVGRAIPTVVTANLLNEQNWRHGNFAANMARGVWEGSLENLKNGVIMGGAGAVVHAGVSRFAVPPHLTPVEARAREFRMWQDENPGGSRAEFTAEIEARQTAESARADAMLAATREARRSLLSDIPPRERGAISDVPILHVDAAQFRTLNGGNIGDAMVYVRDGQAVIVVREGAPPSSLRGLASQVREVVAPGTAGRTVNPADSLPPRLRNRVPVEVVNDPGFGLDEVRAVPHRDADGNIIGVALQVGPNARAADIQNHIATVDAMRRYAGVAGQARMLLGDMARAAGIDVLNPRERGRWEASLEVAKLPRIIEERMLRLSESGLDPRRRALVEQEIVALQSQLARERARLALGVDAAERGYIAAESGGRKAPRRSETSAERAARAAEESNAARQRAEAIAAAREVRDQLSKATDVETELRRAVNALDAPYENLERLVDFHVSRTGPTRLFPRDIEVLRQADQLIANDRRADAIRLIEEHFGERMRSLPPGQSDVAAGALLKAAEAAARMETVRQEQMPELARRLHEASERRAALEAQWRSSRVFDPSNPANLGDPVRMPCLAAETLVQTDVGLRTLESLQCGERVAARDGRFRPVDEVLEGVAIHQVVIQVEGGEEILATRNHRFRTADRKPSWRPARMLYPGLLLQTMRGTAQVKAVTVFQSRFRTRNLIVGRDHVFHVGKVGVLVHNGPGDSSGWTVTARRMSRIYIVYAKDNPNVILYVGKTVRPSVANRFDEHLRSESKQLEDVNWTDATHEIKEVASGMWSPYETAIWEEHFIRQHGGLSKEHPESSLINDVHAIKDENITAYAALHDPCR